MTKKELYIQRCFDIAKLGKQEVSPNPIVGAVLVHGDEIIGEGYHQQYGDAHAEVNAFRAAKSQDKDKLIPASEIYVSLEPCNIYGNTPPCAQKIIDEKLSNVFISCIDKTEGVNNTGVIKLQKAGLKVEKNILQRKGENLVRIRNTFAEKRRPYVVLKWAVSSDGFMGQSEKQVWLSNEFSKRLVHKWRSEIDAILVGTQTAILDNPALTNRFYSGPDPLRIFIDKHGKVPHTHQLNDGNTQTWILKDKINLIPNLLKRLFDEKKSSLLVEGGQNLLKSFIDVGLWDEIRLIKTPAILQSGIESPSFEGKLISRNRLIDDEILIYKANLSCI